MLFFGFARCSRETGRRYACCQILFILSLLFKRKPDGVDLLLQPRVFFVVAQYARKIIAHFLEYSTERQMFHAPQLHLATGLP